MKPIFTLIISFLLISSFSFSQQNFIPHNVTSGGYPSGASLWDIDGDSDLDILVMSPDDHRVAWYRNAGNGYFDSVSVINSETNLVRTAHPADLDQDGDIDLLCCEVGRLCWYPNDGFGNFGNPQVITFNNNTFEKYASSITTDLDNDSLKDILFSSSSDSILAWHKNLGNGNFGPQQIIASVAARYCSIIPVDMDQDGEEDLFCSNWFQSSGFIYTINTWYKKLGSGSFGPEQYIDSIGSYYTRIKTVDLDNDSLPDIISARSYILAWKKNLGGGNFSSSITINGSVEAASFELVDMDGDNDLDMIITDISLDVLTWQENLGGGTFGPSQMICDSLPSPITSCIGDIDNDGDIDIITSTSIHSTLEVFKNTGTNTFDHFQRISYAASSVTDVHVADMNNDGLPDILSASPGDDKVAWYKNLGNQQFSLQKEISTSVNHAAAISTADFDLDGYEDIVVAGGGNDVVFFNGYQTEVFCSSGSIPNSYSSAFHMKVVTEDLDNDNLTDVIWNNGGSLMWSKSLGGGNFGNPQGPYYIWDIDCLGAMDLNRDTLPDLVLSQEHFMFVGINGGGGNFLTLDTLNDTLGAHAFTFADLDNDDDIDIIFQIHWWISIGNDESYLGWYPNDGFGNFDTLIFIPCVGEMRYDIEAIDIDNDGDIDIFTGLSTTPNFDYNLAWYENLGSANFAPPVIIDFGMEDIMDIHASDLDNDGDNDLVLALNHNHTVQWLENTLNNLIDTIVICADDSTFIFGSWVTQPGDYTDTLTNAQGGDSVIIVRLENYQTYFTVDTMEICEGETYNFNAQILDTTGVYFETFQSMYGCDSIIELPLVVVPVPAVSIAAFIPDSVSIDTGLQALPSATPAGGYYSGNGIVTNAFYPLMAGLGEHWILYTYTDTITGCSNQDSTLIKVYDPIGIDELESNKVKLYPNPGTGNFILTGTNLQSIQVKTLTGELVREVAIKDRSEVRFTLAGHAKGVYFVHIVNDDAEVRRLLVLM
ncbi:MAG: T9SS type A sorting domain-containing protein [Bacteroidales bacterium]|nr:T9SS type A sorting domain-containing protein [Bacteroidales bacterium]MCF8458280.1 T9SS type A sorting domain-containing protein [Bacteroidales bacterium]